jgi:hypothetical protein
MIQLDVSLKGINLKISSYTDKTDIIIKNVLKVIKEIEISQKKFK